MGIFSGGKGLDERRERLQHLAEKHGFIRDDNVTATEEEIYELLKLRMKYDKTKKQMYAILKMAKASDDENAIDIISSEIETLDKIQDNYLSEVTMAKFLRSTRGEPYAK